MVEPIRGLFAPAVKPTSASAAEALMIKCGGVDYSLHAVGHLNDAGARCSVCGVEGSFLEAPAGPMYERCSKCFPPANEKEVSGRRRAR